jgi:hypothetical protein
MVTFVQFFEFRKMKFITIVRTDVAETTSMNLTYTLKDIGFWKITENAPKLLTMIFVYRSACYYLVENRKADANIRHLQLRMAGR